MSRALIKIFYFALRNLFIALFVGVGSTFSLAVRDGTQYLPLFVKINIIHVIKNKFIFGIHHIRSQIA
jgi:hypothetical protein